MNDDGTNYPGIIPSIQKSPYQFHHRLENPSLNITHSQATPHLSNSNSEFLIPSPSPSPLTSHPFLPFSFTSTRLTS